MLPNITVEEHAFTRAARSTVFFFGLYFATRVGPPGLRVIRIPVDSRGVEIFKKVI
jgi:hypothetical protein